MTGLKSGSGDDLWADDGDEETSDSSGKGEKSLASSARGRTRENEPGGDRTEEDEPGGDQTGEDEPGANGSGGDESERDDEGMNRSVDPGPAAGIDNTTDQTQPYIVRRALKDKSVQFERDERLTFFVHDDVADGERDLLTDLESKVGRDVPKFDVREAVYRAALRNPDDVLNELLAMGYTLEEG